MDSDVEPASPSPSFSSLPDEMVVNCLARISRSYYPKLCLVCKTFRSLISSGNGLSHARSHLNTKENVLQVCLKLPGRRLPSWFSLWIKPNQTLTNDLEENIKSTGNTLLVGSPSTYSRWVPILIDMVGSKFYVVIEYNIPPTSSPIWVINDWRIHARRKGPKMKVARENLVAGILDGKIYVMGGCSADESENWAEVFDTRTQTWESLPDPGPELRFSSIKTIEVSEGKVYVRSSETKDYFYDPKEGRWGVAEEALEVESRCVIEDVWYSCTIKGYLLWYDRKRKEWREVKGLEVLNRNCGGGGIAIANYGGKLLILWDKSVQPDDERQNKDIWCSVIALERRNGDDQVWGNVEWASVVLTVPSSYVFLRCKVRSV